ncbi:MAG: hypothetical protein K8823_1537 [Cenarchaeum symbiont of Oopsacas minuta]|nr:hypothetical protein [Cenarchaeum symbiont of Oopsacas minuta]
MRKLGLNNYEESLVNEALDCVLKDEYDDALVCMVKLDRLMTSKSALIRQALTVTSEFATMHDQEMRNNDKTSYTCSCGHLSSRHDRLGNCRKSGCNCKKIEAGIF